MERRHGGGSLRRRLSSIPNWKHTLRESCNKRVKEDRMRLLSKLRGSPNDSLPSPTFTTHTNKGAIQSVFQEIVTDELQKMTGSSIDSASANVSVPVPEAIDIDDLWEYDGLHNAYLGDCEEILLEMQKVFYEDLRAHSSDAADPQNIPWTWEDEEDEYLARATYEYMTLKEEDKVNDEVWCPVCKKGLLKQDSRCIYCSLCKLQLHKGDEVNLELLRIRLSEAHADHLDRGCKLTPKFSVESHFGLTALYILCEKCHTFEIIM